VFSLFHFCRDVWERAEVCEFHFGVAVWSWRMAAQSLAFNSAVWQPALCILRLTLEYFFLGTRFGDGSDRSRHDHSLVGWKCWQIIYRGSVFHLTSYAREMDMINVC
jgi:hypothetical protein